MRRENAETWSEEGRAWRIRPRRRPSSKAGPEVDDVALRDPALDRHEEQAGAAGAGPLRHGSDASRADDADQTRPRKHVDVVGDRALRPSATASPLPLAARSCSSGSIAARQLVVRRVVDHDR